MTVRMGFVAAGLAIGALGVGCGDDKKKNESAESSVSAAEARRQVGETRDGLEQALATYKSGDKAKADKQVGDAYLKHFELVEGPLGDRDHELTEELEDGIREELRDKIKAGAPETEVEKLVSELKADLDKAESALR